MCNCKGWDIAYYPDGEITLEQHFCRLLDDCGHVDNTLEEAADEVASSYNALYDQYCDACSQGYYDFDAAHADHLLESSRTWSNRTHPSYVYYSSPQE